MNVRKIQKWLLLLFGEAIIISAFVLFRGATPDNILILNITVSTIVYVLFFVRFRTPWIDLKDKSQKQIGTTGISWFASWSYAILAIGTITCGYFLPELIFSVQLIIHCILLFILFMWLMLSRHSADKVKEVYEAETKNRNGINEMKNAMRHLKDSINDLNGLPAQFTQRINTFEENLRYISPSDNSEAYVLENSFVEVIKEIRFAISDYSMNEDRIESNLKKLERIYQNRKNIYSNKK